MSSSSLPYHCPFVACHQTFATRRLLTLHTTSVHLADKPHPCPECSSRFATLIQLEHHQARSHDQPRKRRRIENHVCIEDDVMLSGDEDEETLEIASNALYLSKQLVVARTRGVSKWGGEDIANAMVWAKWVEDALGDIDNDKHVNIANKLKRKGVAIEGMEKAQTVLVESLLGWQGIGKDMLRTMIEGAQGIVVDGVTNVIERKRRLATLSKLLPDQHVDYIETGARELVGRKRGSKVCAAMWRRMEGRMGFMCKDDMKLLDECLEWLLRKVNEGNEREKMIMRNVVSGVWNVERAAKEMGESVGEDELIRWIREMIDSDGLVGYVSRCVFQEYEIRIGMKIVPS